MSSLMSSYLVPRAFFCAVCLFLYSATALSVERIVSDSYSGRWQLGGYDIYVEMPCELSTSSLLPTKYCSQPYIVIEQSMGSESAVLKSRPYFNFIVGDISIGHKWMFDGNDDPMKKVSISDVISGTGPQKSRELFDLLMSAPETPLTIKQRSSEGGGRAPITIRTVVLADFEAKTSVLIRNINQRYDHEQTARRSNMLIGLCLIGGVLAIVLWLVLSLLKRGRIRLQVAKQGLEMKRVARIAEDEAIREVVRNSVSMADESELDVMRSQIKTALDAGDTETAEKLLSILKKCSNPT